MNLKGGKSIEPDGGVVDSLSEVLRYGLWEAKDSDDDLEKEIKAKFKAGYPPTTSFFRSPAARFCIKTANGYTTPTSPSPTNWSTS